MDSLSIIAQEAGLIGRRARKLFKGSNALYLFQELGVYIDADTYNGNAFSALRSSIGIAVTKATDIIQNAENLIAALNDNQVDFEIVIGLVVDIYNNTKTLFVEINNIKNSIVQISLQTTPDGVSQSSFQAFASSFTRLLVDLLLLTHLRGLHAKLYTFLVLFGIIRNKFQQSPSSSLVPQAEKTINLRAITDLLKNPYNYFVQYYGWNTPEFAFRLLLMNIYDVLQILGVNSYFEFDPYDISKDPVLHVNEVFIIKPAVDTTYAFQIILKAPAVNGVFPVPINFAGWSIELGSAVNISIGTIFKVKWDGGLEVSSPAATTADISLRLSAKLPVGPGEYKLFDTPFGTSLSADAIELAITFTTPAITTAGGTVGNGKMGFFASFKPLHIRINPAETDSFIAKLFGGQPTNAQSDVSLDWSQGKGLNINGAQGLLPRKPINLSLGPVKVQNLLLGLEPKAEGVSVVGALSATALLGPIQVSIADIGFQTNIDYDSGNLGPFGITLGFKAPSGVGIRVTSEVVSGGGYLYIDSPNHKYAGVATLDIKDTVKVNALGLLQTKLPNNRSGYSFLLLITAEFTPIQLGLGFTLNGLGGLIGINRAANTNFLREQVRTGNLARLLFPQNVLDNPAAALATADNGFPATEGRYVFGLMAKIGWGTPTLITLDLGLIIELPAPVRLLILGSLQAVLPTADKAILKLRADFLGVIDFGARTAEFDASLVNSFILTYALTGDLAARIYWGEKPVFLQTAGGFHPAFQPPANANLPTLRRLTLAFANSSDFKLILYSYFAVTSNTVQFGSRLELFVDLPGSYYLTGFLGFDALFQFNPFRVLTQAGAGLAIKKGNSTKLSLYLSLTISGPAPWHVVGEGSFKILCFKIKFRVDRTFGGSAPAQPLPNVDVRQLLVAALQDRATWAVEAPAVRATSSVALRTEADATQLVLEPGGALAFRQQVAPFGVTLERFGQAVPVNGRRFELSRVTLGTSPTGAASTPLEDQFAPGQFRQLSDAQRLSAPSFQLLRSGARIGGVEGYAGGRSISRDTGYDYYLLSNVGADVAGRAAGSTTPTSPEATYSRSKFNIDHPLDTLTLQKLGRLGAVSKGKQSYEQRRASRLAPDQVKWDTDDYLLVYTADLTRYGNGSYASETEASQALAQLVATNADLADDLQVLPAYHLDTLVAL